MSEHFVTTIGEIGLVMFEQRKAGLGSKTTGRRRAPPRRRGKSWNDGIDGLMGIGDFGDEDPTDPDTILIPPVLQPPVGVALSIPEPQAPATSSGSPAPAVPRKEAWAKGDGSYILQSGDTLWGLALTYLGGAGTRWREIWNAQPNAYRTSHSPDKIFAGELLAMPSEAQAKARAMGLYGIGATVVGRGFTKKQIAIAAAGAAAVVGGIWAVNR